MPGRAFVSAAASGNVRAGSWRLRVGQSPIHGRGVFAEEDIPAGTLVVECRGRIIGPADVYDGLRVLQIGPEAYLAEDDGDPSLDNFINHSCDPSLGFVAGAPLLHTLRVIRAGEELSFDYSTTMNEPGWCVPCGCRASACRGFIQSYCDLAPETRDRLRPIALAYLRSLD